MSRTDKSEGSGPPHRMPSNEEIQAMARLFYDGKLEESLALGLALYGKYPEAPLVSNMLGVVTARMGSLDEALTHYHRAISLKPGYAEAHNNLGNVLSRLNRPDEAIACFQKAVANNSNYAEAYNNLANILQYQEKFEAAVETYGMALRVRSDYAEAHNGLGNALRGLGRHEEAVASFAEAIAISPGFVQAHKNMGDALRSLGRLDQAIRSFQRAIQGNPTYPQPYLGLGLILNDLGKHGEAVRSFKKVIQLNPNLGQAYVGLGKAQGDLGLHEEAMASYQEAIRINPGLAEAHCLLGNSLSEFGRHEAAIASYAEAVRLQPDLAEAHINLSRLKRYRRDDPQIAQMLERMNSPSLSENEKMHLSFALGKVYEDLDDVDLSFKYYLDGNRLRRNAIKYDIDADKAKFEQIKSLFNAETAGIVEKEGLDNRLDSAPIFVLGMPRSGTTLVEQILASHSQVRGGGELETLERLLGQAVENSLTTGSKRLAPEDLMKYRGAYLEEIAGRASGKPYLTDKMPSNFKWIGFLLALVPGVKIVHVRRNPMATCWSMFKLQFRAHGYSNDLRDLGEYYRLYEDLMAFWRQEFPGQIYDLDYELLTENQERETRNLLSYCGLDWEDRCLEFYNTRRAVRTMSDNQVRQRMYTGSSEAWLKYQDHLKPLSSILDGRSQHGA